MNELSCEAVLSQLNSVFDGESIGAEVEESVAAHLDSCVFCARAAREMSSVHRLMLELQAQEIAGTKTKPQARVVRPSSRAKMSAVRRDGNDQSFVWWVAASVAAALVMLVFLLSGSKRNEVADKKQAPGVPAPPAPAVVDLAQRRRDAEEQLTRAEAEQQRVLNELAALERKREQFRTAKAAPQPQPNVVSEEEKQRLEALAKLDAARQDIELELQRAREAHDRASSALAQAQADQHATRPQIAEVKAPPAGVQVIGQIRSASSASYLERDHKRLTLSAGFSLLPGDSIQTGNPSGDPTGVEVSLALYNGAAVDLRANTAFQVVDAMNSRLVEGQIYADVAKDGSGQKPAGYRWVVKTGFANVGITGTKFSLLASETQSRVQMEEGTVDFFNAAGKQRVSALQESVANGNAAPGAPAAIALNAFWRGHNATQAENADEILLLPIQGRLVGTEWQLVRDEHAAKGVALEASKAMTKLSRDVSKFSSYVSYSFKAEANKDYYVWVRGCNMATKDPIQQDAVVLWAPEGTMIEAEGPNKGTTRRADAALFNGYSLDIGYWWVGGDADKTPDGTRPDETPVIVRFSKSGEQVLKMFEVEGPQRIDLIWISSTQKKRPEAGSYGPLKTTK